MRGELLPPELAQIMSRLRADADPMPPKQLQQALNAQWGAGWIARFSQFNVRPIAAASIGQVHRARTKDGRDLATKQLVLLDFGATREFGPQIVQGFRTLMIAGIDGDHMCARQALMRIGFFDAQTPLRHQDMVMAMFDLAMQPLRQDTLFDFGTTDLALGLRNMGLNWVLRVILGTSRRWTRCFCSANLPECICWPPNCARVSTCVNFWKIIAGTKNFTGKFLALPLLPG